MRVIRVELNQQEIPRKNKYKGNATQITRIERVFTDSFTRFYLSDPCHPCRIKSAGNTPENKYI
jgi:hypothetical protein